MSDERRLHNRLHPGDDQTADIWCLDSCLKAHILDIGLGGMRVVVSEPLEEGVEIISEIRLRNSLGSFFVRGQVSRVVKSEGYWEIAVNFNKISAIPLKPTLAKVTA